MSLSANLAERLNDQLFLLINAPANASPLMLEIGKIAANYLIVIFPAVLLCYWFSFDHQRRHQALLALVTSLVALGGNLLIGEFWQHPRPFMVPVGHTFLHHVADSSFPSDHMTLALAVSLSLLAGHKNVTGSALFAFSLVIAWGRVYMGVHFPADMAGSLLVALVSVGLVRRAENRLKPLFEKVGQLHDSVFYYLKGRTVNIRK